MPFVLVLVLETCGAFVWCAIYPGPGGEPLWIVPENPAIFCLGACMTANLLKQAAPGNVSTRNRFIGALSGSRIPQAALRDKTSVR